MKEFFKKNQRLVLIISSAALAVLGFVFILCACLTGGGKSKLSVPGNVKLTENVLSWDEVENAEKGYTVKIGSDESTTVTATSLDLTTVTSKLTEGENKLSVKANATDSFDASAYSTEVTYIYRTPFAAPTQLQIDTTTGILSWNSVSGATAYIVSVVGGTQEKEVTETHINLVQFDLEKDAKVKFGVKVKASGYKLESAQTESTEYTVPDYAKLLKDAITTLTDGIGTIGDDATANEKVIADVNKFIADVYNTYPDKIKNDNDVKTAYDALIGKRTEAETKIKDVVDGLASGIAEALFKDYTSSTPIKDDYDALKEKQDAINALGDYAKKYWNENTEYVEKEQKIAAKIADILTIPASATKTESAVFINRDHGAKSEFFVIVKFVNVLEQPVRVTTVPNITVDGNEDTEGEKVYYNSDASSYVYTVGFTCPAQDSSVNVTYSIGNIVSTVTKTVKYPSNIIHTANEEPHHLINDGKVMCYGNIVQDAPLYADVYNENDIVADGRDTDITIKGAALATLQITNNMAEDSLKTLIALKGILGTNLKLRLVLYNIENDTYTTINSSSVSETLTYTLTEENKIARIPFYGDDACGIEINGDNEGGLSCGSDFDANKIAGVFNDTGVTADTVRNFVRFHVFVYKRGNEMGSFYADIPNDGRLAAATIRRNVYIFCGDTTANDGITLRLSIALKENSEFEGKVRESLVSPDKEWGYSASRDDIRFTGEGLNNVAIGDTEIKTGSFAYGSWEWASDNNNTVNHENYLHDYHNGLAVLVFDATNTADAETYDFVANQVTPFATYIHKTFGAMEWADINAQINAVWSKLTGTNKTNPKKFVFALQVIANSDGLAANYIDSLPKYFVNSADNTKHAVVDYTRDWSVPTGNQLSLTRNDNGCFEFLRENQPKAAGSIFNEEYGVKYIEIMFTVKLEGNDTKDYFAYLFLNKDIVTDDGVPTLSLYANTNKTGIALDCGKASYYTNGWLHVSDFNNWINGKDDEGNSVPKNSEYTDLNNFDLKNGEVEFRTKIYHDGTYFVGEGSYYPSLTEKGVTYPQS